MRPSTRIAASLMPSAVAGAAFGLTPAATGTSQVGRRHEYCAPGPGRPAGCRDARRRLGRLTPPGDELACPTADPSRRRCLTGWTSAGTRACTASHSRRGEQCSRFGARHAGDTGSSAPSSVTVHGPRLIETLWRDCNGNNDVGAGVEHDTGKPNGEAKPVAPAAYGRRMTAQMVSRNADIKGARGRCVATQAAPGGQRRGERPHSYARSSARRRRAAGYRRRAPSNASSRAVVGGCGLAISIDASARCCSGSTPPRPVHSANWRPVSVKDKPFANAGPRNNSRT
jgi:hypothetical protein